jgi:hypothetical protein
MFSDRDQGRIQAIDGYQLVPRERKEGQRAFYSNLPERESRQQADPAVKKFYKQYYNKYPTPQQQVEHPIEKFVPPNKTVFQLIRDAASAFLNKCGFIIKKKDSAGTIIAQHSMPIVQKLSTAIYHNMVENMYSKINPGYNWEKDDEHVKSKLVQKDILKKMGEVGSDGLTRWQRYIKSANTLQIMDLSIRESVNQINKNAGEIVLKIDYNGNDKDGLPIYQVADLNVIEETKRKATKKEKGYPMPKVRTKQVSLQSMINPHPNGPTFPSSGTVMKGEMPKETPWGDGDG